MTEHQDKINQLLEKLDALLTKQDHFSHEIRSLEIEIDKLRTAKPDLFKHIPEGEVEEEQEGFVPSIARDMQDEMLTDRQRVQHTRRARSRQRQQKRRGFKLKWPSRLKGDVEKFIGENLISKIGIIITVAGVAIGAKYTIEHDLISPLTRIILGYLVGLVLLGFGIKLKKKYANYSAVLVGGAMAIMYFITYAAYTFYDLLPQTVAFAIMVALTVFTTTAAILYNKQIIAHIGLVGAYAVPFLLSDGSENAEVLFTYTAIINVGILVVALKRYWKPLYYTAFVLTWLMYALWFLPDIENTVSFGLALTFLSIFFVIFYVTFLGYKLLHKEKFNIGDILLLLTNSFIFYAIGYLFLESHETGKELLGMFTIWNAVIHFIVGAIIHRQQLADRNLFYMVSGLVLVFITLAIPVQLDGNWVTLLWAGEAALLFWVGRTKNAPVYEILSYPLIVLACFSIMQDWTTVYNAYMFGNPDTRIVPIINVHFLTSILTLGAFGFINALHQNKQYAPALTAQKELASFISYLLPSIFLLTLYFALRFEIETYWNQLYTDSTQFIDTDQSPISVNTSNEDFNYFKTLWVINYSLLFASALTFINMRKLRHPTLGMISLWFNVFVIGVFLTLGLVSINALRDSFISQPMSEYFHRGPYNIVVRYISFAFVALTLFMSDKYIRQEIPKPIFRVVFDFILHISILAIASNELINWMELAESTQSDKLGLSILWGVYSLLLIALGIWKKKKYLRIGAISLFGLTLIKLFFYDITHLNTIAKTIVFVSLGVLLLIISFLYNKYKVLIFGDTDSSAPITKESHSD